jgi:hypothetical protein
MNIELYEERQWDSIYSHMEEAVKTRFGNVVSGSGVEYINPVLIEGGSLWISVRDVLVSNISLTLENKLKDYEY